MPLSPRDMPRSATLQLPLCGACGALSYPPRPRCGHCLADALRWSPCHGEGTVLASARVAHSHDNAWRPYLPVDVVSVHLAAGPVALAFAPLAIEANSRCELRPLVDREGQVRLFAVVPGTDPDDIRHWLDHQRMELPDS